MEHDTILLFRLVNAANYLKIQPLLSLAVLATALSVSSSVDGDKEEEIKSIFKVSSSSSSTLSSSSSLTLSLSSMMSLSPSRQKVKQTLSMK